jgi:hypothetical protein
LTRRQGMRLGRKIVSFAGITPLPGTLIPQQPIG